MYKFNPDYNIPPSETIRELLEDKEIDIAMFASMMNIKIHIAISILNNETRLNDSLLSKLDDTFKIPKSFWFNLENGYVNKLKEELQLGDYGKVVYEGEIYTVEMIEDAHYGLKELGEWVWKEDCEEIKD